MESWKIFACEFLTFLLTIWQNPIQKYFEGPKNTALERSSELAQKTTGEQKSHWPHRRIKDFILCFLLLFLRIKSCKWFHPAYIKGRQEHLVLLGLNPNSAEWKWIAKPKSALGFWIGKTRSTLLCRVGCCYGLCLLLEVWRLRYWASTENKKGNPQDQVQVSSSLWQQ